MHSSSSRTTCRGVRPSCTRINQTSSADDTSGTRKYKTLTNLRLRSQRGMGEENTYDVLSPVSCRDVERGEASLKILIVRSSTQPVCTHAIAQNSLSFERAHLRQVSASTQQHRHGRCTLTSEEASIRPANQGKHNDTERGALDCLITSWDTSTHLCHRANVRTSTIKPLDSLQVTSSGGSGDSSESNLQTRK